MLCMNLTLGSSPHRKKHKSFKNLVASLDPLRNLSAHRRQTNNTMYTKNLRAMHRWQTKKINEVSLSQYAAPTYLFCKAEDNRQTAKSRASSHVKKTYGKINTTICDETLRERSFIS